MRSRLLFTVLLAAFSCVTGCIPSWQGTARSEFAEQNSCPAERTTVTKTQPPEDVARDPERRAMWEDSHHLFDVSGCGKQVTLNCYTTGGDLLSPQRSCMAEGLFALFGQR